ncbi:MAG: tRNA epoxyqueuosine(34) reductase QueG, partial [Bryobacteraceae bacterium]
PVTGDAGFAAAHFAPSLEELAQLSADEFHLEFGGGPVERARYSGVLRSAAVAMGNSPLPEFREPLARLASGADEQVAEHARWALGRMG